MQKTIDLLPALPLWVYALALAIVLLVCRPFLRAIIWKIFSFDHSIRDVLAQKKSSEVRLGRIAEALSPVLEDFPVDVHKAGTSTVFLGQPVDFVHFDPEDGITFVEVKTGNSRLSASQRAIKEHIEAGNVRWESFRVKG